MQSGQTVRFFDRKKSSYCSAMLIKIDGHGLSGAKLLTLEVDKDKFSSVVHFDDSKGVNQFWTLFDDPIPKNWNEKTKTAK